MRPRNELRRINRHLDRYQRLNGEGVFWYEFDGENSAPTDYLLEGTRHYKAPIFTPLLWVIESEDTESGQAEGRRLTPTLRSAVSMETLVKSGLSDPHDSERHLNDVIQYQRTLYGIGRYEIRGRLGREDVIVGINAVKAFPDEDWVFDTLPPGVAANATIRDKTAIDGDAWAVFPDHELPARHS